MKRKRFKACCRPDLNVSSLTTTSTTSTTSSTTSTSTTTIPTLFFFRVTSQNSPTFTYAQNPLIVREILTNEDGVFSTNTSTIVISDTVDENATHFSQGGSPIQLTQGTDKDLRLDIDETVLGDLDVIDVYEADINGLPLDIIATFYKYSLQQLNIPFNKNYLVDYRRYEATNRISFVNYSNIPFDMGTVTFFIDYTLSPKEVIYSTGQFGFDNYDTLNPTESRVSNKYFEQIAANVFFAYRPFEEGYVPRVIFKNAAVLINADNIANPLLIELLDGVNNVVTTFTKDTPIDTAYTIPFTQNWTFVIQNLVE